MNLWHNTLAALAHQNDASRRPATASTVIDADPEYELRDIERLERRHPAAHAREVALAEADFAARRQATLDRRHHYAGQATSRVTAACSTAVPRQRGAA